MEKERLKVRLAVFLILEENHELILMRRSNTGHRDGELGLPSGHVEPGETPEEAMIREAWEEVRVAIPKGGLSLVHTQFNAESGPDRLYINLYFVPSSSYSGKPQIGEPEQCSEMVRVPRLSGDCGWSLTRDVIPYVATALAYIAKPHTAKGARFYSEVGL